ncbi:MAG: serine protease [Actinomycetia bacterium]|nr:serine protease [Actinomycetes bacterium]
MSRTYRTLAVLFATLALLGAACTSDSESDGGDGGDGGSGAVSSVEDAKGAVVQIEAAGEFRDPEVGVVSGGGTGSGFIIDPSGIIVTNNHVVTGAGSLKVHVGGEKTDIAAEVLGVSECNDLAVIKLDDEGPWPYLQISDTAPEPPLDVYALGFPLGDPEYTATKGVVSKASADGESSWASVASVIEHDANIQPGNSGGPLVDDNGMVVGVNYSSFSNAETTTQQFYAINADLAGDVVETLKEGDELSIGVNGTAVLDEESGIAGVWVNAVDAGGPAKKAGVQPGDIITNLNGVALASGTMEEYCDVLRSSSEGDVVSMRVLRFDTEEILEGEINGEELTTAQSFAAELGDQVQNTGGSDVLPADAFVEIVDDTDRIATRIPGEWEISTSPQDLLELGTAQPTVVAAPSIDAFNGNAGPGVQIIAVDGVTPDVATLTGALDALVEGSGCAEQNREDYEDSVLSGPAAVLDCGGGVVGVALVAATNQNPDAAVVFAGQASTDGDLDVLDTALAALVVR